MLDAIYLEGKSVKIAMILAVIIVAFIASAVVKYITKSKLASSIEDSNTHIKTYANVIKGLCQTSIFVIAVYLILRILGIDVKGMVAGVGVTAIVIGFALQDLLKDIIAALSVMYSNTFDIGDQVGIGQYRGQVIDFNLRRTTIHDTSMNIDVVMNNRDITRVEKLRNYFSYYLPIPNSKSPDECKDIINAVASRIESVESVERVVITGLQFFTDETIVYKYNIVCDMLRNAKIKRDINQMVYEYYHENNMKVIHKDVRLYH